MKSFVFTALAARDLNEIWDYLASDNIQAADRVLDALEKALRGLRGDLADRRHRFFLVYSYLIVYRPETKPMQVMSAPRLTGHSGASGFTARYFLISVISVYQW
jgi:plasmid stabilization system protein ParE